MRLSPQSPESIDALFGGMSVDEMDFSFDNHLFDASTLGVGASSGGCMAVRARRPDGAAFSATSSDFVAPSPVVGVWGGGFAESDEWMEWLRASVPGLEGGGASSGQSVGYVLAYVPEFKDGYMVLSESASTYRNRRLTVPQDRLSCSESAAFLFWCWTWSRFDPVEAEWTVEPQMQQIDSWEVR